MKNITGVFEGGGIRGIALAGAAAATLDLGYEFKRSVGTSAGAIVSSLVAAGYSSAELREAVIGVDWPSLLPDKTALSKNVSMLMRLGFYSSSPLERLLRRMLEAKSVRTFADLPDRALAVVATDLNHGRGLVLPEDLPGLGHNGGDFSVAEAVLMSASVPFVFEPVKLTDLTSGEELLMADGAMAARFPAQLVPRDPSTIGFRLRLPTHSHTHHDIKGPVSLATAVIGAGITAREDLPPLCGPLVNVVDITLAHDSLDFEVSPGLAGEMFDTGYAAAQRHLVAAPVMT